MTDNDFRLLLEAAVCGDREALDSLLALYMPLINRLSSYAGNLDEDCRQYIMLHFGVQNLDKGSGDLPEP